MQCVVHLEVTNVWKSRGQKSRMNRICLNKLDFMFLGDLDATKSWDVGGVRYFKTDMLRPKHGGG